MAGVEQKKAEKRQALLDAAYALFLEHGASKTSVSDITARANVAKGTFYLYFRDKDAVLRALLAHISYRVLSEAYLNAESVPDLAFSERTVKVVDYIIEYFRREKIVLRLIERNFTLPTLEEFREAARTTPVLQNIRDSIHSSAEFDSCTEDDVYRRMSAILGMCTSVCYSAIMENRPDTIDNMKPVLYGIIRASL